jgi:hypothetical protein
MHKDEPISVLTAIIIAVASIGCFVFIVVIQRLQSLQAEVAAGNAVPVDVSGWQTYGNSQYGFALEYPPGWTVSTDGLANTSPFIVFGNPLTGTSVYDLQVFIENNSSSLSSGVYAHGVLAAARAADTPTQFAKAYVLTVGGYPAYELYQVFEIDHNAERIYVAHGTEVLRFDFPVAEEDPGIALPVANNPVAHEIMNTLSFQN